GAARELVELCERAGIEQVVDAFPRGHLALGVLALHRPLRSGVNRLGAPLLKVGELARGGVDVDRLVALVGRTWLAGVDPFRFGGHAAQGRPERARWRAPARPRPTPSRSRPIP